MIVVALILLRLVQFAACCARNPMCRLARSLPTLSELARVWKLIDEVERDERKRAHQEKPQGELFG